jgi:methylmalonyl-CoA mutase, C-terminal domain
MNEKRRIKVLTAKMGLDCHDTGITTISHFLRDAGFEVIYLGLHSSAEKILRAAQEEDVDVIGLSFLSGQHIPQTKKLMQLIKKKGVNVMVILGGVIPKDDILKLENVGVGKVFVPGTMSNEIIQYIKENVNIV